MKFIHTSDWHIGRQFHNVSLLEDQRHVLNQLVEHIEREAVDAVVIAGDVYDRSVPPAAAVALLDEVLNRICNELGVPVLLISGNHDSAERIRFGSRQLRQAGLHIIGELKQINEPVKISGSSLDVNFFGIPYNDPETVRNQFGADVSTHDEAHRYLVEQIINAKSANTPSILISHCFIDGWDESDSERPLSIGGADRIGYEAFTGFDYVALGHLHGPQHKGEPHIRYSGSILKYSFSEQNQRKGVTLVEMAADGMKSATHLPLHPLRDMRILEGELNTLLEQGKTDPHNEDYLLVRLTDKTTAFNACDAAWRKLQERYNQLQGVKTKLGKAHEKNAELDAQYRIYGTLSEAANGQNASRISLQRFVLSVLLDDVLIQASQRLHLMSNGRYQLVRKDDRAKGNRASGLDLEVEDGYTGKNRPVATLSGGESFMAALSLALGLSDVVQSYAGGIKLDTLFIDEGFGSLDPEALDLAIRTLIDLQATGRMIGIISHVSELKEQMALRLDVISSKNGSSIRTVFA